MYEEMYMNEYPLHHEEKPGTISTLATSIVKAVLKCGRDFCKETSIHGFNHIAAPRRHWVERILWIAATALAIWGALDVSLGQLQRYNESPTVVTLEKDFRSWRFSLPAVTYCYKNRVDSAKLPAVIKKHWNIEPSDEKYAYYTRLVEAVANSDLFHLERFQEFSDLEIGVDMFSIAVEVKPEVQIKTMSSEGANYKWIPVITEAGACYVTNSLAVSDVAVTALNPNESVGLPVTCKYSSLSCYIIMDVSTAADFYVHSPYDVMDITHPPSAVYLTLTRNTELSIMDSRCGKGVKELQPKRRGCSYTDEPTDSGRKVYSTNTCRLSCRSRLAKQLCGCIPFYYFYEDGPKCSPAGMWCLAGFVHVLSNNNGEKCPCAPQCIDCIYKEISTTDQIWDRLPFKLRGSVKFVVQAPRTRYTREIVFHFQDLVGSILIISTTRGLREIHDFNYTLYILFCSVILTVSFGGAAGLFLGASFISFVEILYFLLARLFKATTRTEEKKITVKVKEISEPHEALRIKQLTAILDKQQYEEYHSSIKY